MKRKYEQPQASAYLMETLGMIASSDDSPLENVQEDDLLFPISGGEIDPGNAI